MNNNNIAVSAKNITKSFGKLTAVKGVSLEIREGEIYGLIGPDGAGKTTFIRMLAGILQPDSGDSYICGLSSSEKHQEIKSSLAYMSQKFGLYQDLTVYENIRLYADLYGVDSKEMKTQIEELLDFSYMRPFRNRRAGKLSGGMKQKLQLICALIHKPKVLLLDEPTNGVDPVSRRDFWRILYKLSSEGVTILVSTAYLDEAERCSHISLMNNGGIITTGTPHEVIASSGMDIASVNIENGTADISAIRKLLPDKSVHKFGEKIRIITDSYENTAEKIAAGFSGMKVQREKPMLEDIFMSLQPKSAAPDKLINLVSEGVEKKTGSSVIANSLTKTFGDFTAVNSIDLDVRYGEIYGFLGPNGAGKSTTIKMLCGLLAPSSGSGSVAGFDISSDHEKIKANIGYMSQKFSLYEDLKIYENIDFYGGIYGLYGSRLKRRREWALELSGLKDRKNEMTVNLAGGWRQRLALACAIIHSPSIVFLDEPTSGADPASRRLFWDIIARLASDGVTVFVSTHYMEEAEYCSRLSMIFRGCMVAQGTPRQLKENSMDSSIVNIRVEYPQLYIDDLSEFSSVNDIALFGAGLHIRTDTPEKAGIEISDYFTSRKISAETGTITPSMEDVFVSLIDRAEVKNA